MESESTPQSDTAHAPHGFNWGAFWLSFIWGIAHRSWLTLVILPVGLLSIVVGVTSIFLGPTGSAIRFAFNAINLGLAIWFGIKGNQWAWRTRGLRTEAQFRKREKIWALFGWIVGLLAISFTVWGLATSNTSSGTLPSGTPSLTGSSIESVQCAPGVTMEINGVDQCQK